MTCVTAFLYCADMFNPGIREDTAIQFTVIWHIIHMTLLYDTVQACSTRVCMITGDAEDTAIAVASAVGFYDPLHHRTLSGAEIEGLSGRRLEVSSTVPGMFSLRLRPRSEYVKGTLPLLCRVSLTRSPKQRCLCLCFTRHTRLSNYKRNPLKFVEDTTLDMTPVHHRTDITTRGKHSVVLP